MYNKNLEGILTWDFYMLLVLNFVTTFIVIISLLFSSDFISFKY